MVHRFGLLRRGALLWLLVGMLIAPSPAGAAGNRWTTVGIADPNGLATANYNNALFGNLVCVTAADCWTAGTGADKSGGDVPFLERWDGSAFKLVASPVSKSFLQGTACASSSDCWVAGGEGTPSSTFGQVGHFVPLLDHYNGSKWSAVHPPNPGSAPDDELADVSCRSATNCYAVGWTRSDTGARTLIEFWNGKRWQLASHAALAGQTFSEMVGIDCPSKCIAVGDESATSKSAPHVVAEVQAPHRVKHRTVLQWESVPMPSPKSPNNDTSVNGLSCPALNDCLATGSAYYWPDQGLDPGEAVAWHWNGQKWSLIMPNLAGPSSGGEVNQLSDAYCTGRSSCWAVGSTFTDMQQAPAVTASWNGTKFTKSSNDNPYDMDHLDAVGCAKDGSCVAVGWGSNSGGNAHTIALKLKG